MMIPLPGTTLFKVLTNTVSVLVNYMCMRKNLGAEADWHDAAHLSGAQSPSSTLGYSIFIGNELLCTRSVSRHGLDCASWHEPR